MGLFFYEATDSKWDSGFARTLSVDPDLLDRKRRAGFSPHHSIARWLGGVYQIALSSFVFNEIVASSKVLVYFQQHRGMVENCPLFSITSWLRSAILSNNVRLRRLANLSNL